MSRPLLYTIFILKFLLGIGLIVWTVMMTLSSDVGQDDDNAFLSTYHKVDDNFNDMVISNFAFDDKYNLRFTLNNDELDGITLKDAFLGQRSIKERKIRRDILNIGKNTFKYKLTTKDGKEVLNAKLTMVVTMTTNHIHDKTLEFKNKYVETFDVQKKGYWNITGTIEVGTNKGYFFIKTNAR